jgi:hypothetical protein
MGCIPPGAEDTIGAMRRRGAKAVTISCGVLGAIVLGAAGWAWYESLVLEVQVIPARSVWHQGETITGTVVVRNRRPRAVKLSRRDLTRLAVLEASGEPVPRRRELVYCFDIDVVEMAPFGGLEAEFEVCTDPLSVESIYLRPGKYLLSAAGFLRGPSCKMRWRDAPVEVRPAPGADPERRIVRFSAGGGRLGIARWSGEVESFDLETGRRRSAARLGSRLDGLNWPQGAAFSPDGLQFAALRGRGQDGAPEVELLSLSGSTPSSRAISVPMALGLDGFVASSGWLRIARFGGILELDGSTGELSTLEFPESVNAVELSPDGRHRLEWRSLVAEDGFVSTEAFLAENGATTADALELPGGALDCTTLLGRRGIYCSDSKEQAVSFLAYGSTLWTRLSETALELISESPDGRYLLLGATSGEVSSRRLELWDVEEAVEVHELEVAGFKGGVLTGPPLLLICGLEAKGAGGASWYEERFEVHDPLRGERLRVISTAAEPAAR